MNNEELIRGAISAAAHPASLQLNAKELQAGGKSAGNSVGELCLTLELNGAVQQYNVRTRTRIRGRSELDAAIPPSLSRLSTSFPTLLITPHLTAALAEECVRRDLQFIDLAGNMHLHVPGQYVLVIGRGPTDEIKRLKLTSGHSITSASASALRMIFALLCEPQLLNQPYRNIAAAAGIALGTVGAVLDDLRERRLLSGKDERHGRHLLNPGTLRDEWVTNYPIRLMPKLNVQRFTAQDPTWWEKASIPAGQAWWGGEVAASASTRQLRAMTQTLYINPADRQTLTLALVKRHRLRADPSGSLEILDAFWDFGNKSGHLTSAPSLLVYADLMRTREPRNLEAAALIREQWST
jgi:hypothetical protein